MTDDREATLDQLLELTCASEPLPDCTSFPSSPLCEGVGNCAMRFAQDALSVDYQTDLLTPEAFAHEVRRIKQSGGVCVAVCMDGNNLKAMNEVGGYPFGDVAIEFFARSIKDGFEYAFSNEAFAEREAELADAIEQNSFRYIIARGGKRSDEFRALIYSSDPDRNTPEDMMRLRTLTQLVALEVIEFSRGAVSVGNSAPIEADYIDKAIGDAEYDMTLYKPFKPDVSVTMLDVLVHYLLRQLSARPEIEISTKHLENIIQAILDGHGYEASEDSEE